MDMMEEFAFYGSLILRCIIVYFVIIFALPFSVVVLLMMVALYRELDHERRMMGLFITPDAVPERGRPYRSYEDGDPRRGSTSGRPSSK